MNHLAHFHLTGGSEPRVVGALLGDCIKGPLDGRLSQPLELGEAPRDRAGEAAVEAGPQLRDEGVVAYEERSIGDSQHRL